MICLFVTGFFLFCGFMSIEREGGGPLIIWAKLNEKTFNVYFGGGKTKEAI